MKSRPSLRALLAVAVLASATFVVSGAGATTPPGHPGTKLAGSRSSALGTFRTLFAPTPFATTAAAPRPLSSYYSASGFISASLDAAGTNDPTGTTIRVQKNPGATVRKAFLFAASTGLSGYEPVDGDVTLDGQPVAWNPADTIGNSISSVNVAADVTALVKPQVDAAPAGTVDFAVAEPNNTSLIDGEILAVVLNDPTVTQPSSVTFLYGAEATTGDAFHAALAQPVNKSNPNFALDLSLGISFGYQPSSQYSSVDVDGSRLTTSAGGQDDGEGDNGALITVGGLGDLNDNPPDPNATDTSCSGFFGTAPRCDDELYSLLPFVSNGDTSLDFATANPSADDNIFFAALIAKASAAVVLPGVVLAPLTGTDPVGKPHTVTATVSDAIGTPIQGVSVSFNVTSGPNAGKTATALTDSAGKAQFTYSSKTAGTDHIVASAVDAAGKHVSNEVTETWTGSLLAVLFIQGIGSQSMCPAGSGFVDRISWLRNAIASLPALSGASFRYYAYRSPYTSSPTCADASVPQYSQRDSCWSIDDKYSGKLFSGTRDVSGGGEGARLASFLRSYLNANPGKILTIVAHSQGGVLASYVVKQQLGPVYTSRIRAIVTLDSPLRGINSAGAAILRSNSNCANGDKQLDSSFDMEPGSAVIHLINNTARPLTKLYTVDADPGGWCGSCFPLVDDTHSTMWWATSHIRVAAPTHTGIWTGCFKESSGVVCAGPNGLNLQSQGRKLARFAICAIGNLNADCKAYANS